MKLQQSRAHMKSGRQPPGPHLAELVEYLQESWALAWVHLSFEASTKIKDVRGLWSTCPHSRAPRFSPWLLLFLLKCKDRRCVTYPLQPGSEEAHSGCSWSNLWIQRLGGIKLILQIVVLPKANDTVRRVCIPGRSIGIWRSFGSMSTDGKQDSPCLIPFLVLGSGLCTIPWVLSAIMWVQAAMCNSMLIYWFFCYFF